MKKNIWIFLAVPVLLILAIGIAVYFNQPKINKVDDVKYVDVNGDDYLAQEYITQDQEGIGNDPITQKDGNYFVPVKLSDCESRPQGEQRDTCYLLFTSITEKPEGCEKITDRVVKDDCFTRAAYLSKNAALCENVRFGYSQCYSDVATDTNNASLCEKTDFERRQCFAAVSARDGTLCAPSEDMSSCVFAVLDNNSQKCNEIHSYKSFCYHSIATETNNFSLCNKLSEPEKGSCIFRVALNTNNPNLCEYLADTRDSCVAWIAFNTNNKDLCLKAGAEAQSCIEDLS